jgi:hypothetical protein
VSAPVGGRDAVVPVAGRRYRTRRQWSDSRPVEQPGRGAARPLERLALSTGRLERLRDFYTDRLGAQASPLYDDPVRGGRAVFLDFCGVGLELIVIGIDMCAGPPSYRVVLISLSATRRMTGAPPNPPTPQPATGRPPSRSP